MDVVGIVSERIDPLGPTLGDVALVRQGGQLIHFESITVAPQLHVDV